MRNTGDAAPGGRGSFVSFGARALIRLGALSHNFNVIKNRTPDAAIMAVVKANAYGHGLSAVACALPDVDSFAVARLPEALELRKAGIDHPVVLLSGVYTEQELRDACDAQCELVAHCPHQLDLLESAGAIGATVWLKIDTGMNRLGFSADDAESVIRRLRACESVSELRLMTHLANADNSDDSKTDTQLAIFEKIAHDFDGDISIANSGGIFGWQQSVSPGYRRQNRKIWLRPGIALYGISPFPEKNGSALGLQPVMQFESRLVAVKAMGKGERVGYGGTWQTKRDTVLGIVSAGYGDGYTRYLPSGTPVLVNGRRVPIAGAVSMDMAAVDLGPGNEDHIGDAVVLWGDDLPVEEVARYADSLAYQLVCGVMNREASSIVAE